MILLPLAGVAIVLGLFIAVVFIPVALYYGLTGRIAELAREGADLFGESNLQNNPIRIFKGGHNTPPASAPANRPSHMRGPANKLPDTLDKGV